MNDSSRNSREILIDQLRVRALRTDGPFTLASGAVSDWYLDARQVTYDGSGAAVVGAAVADAIDPTATAVGGLTMGADPIATATALVAAQHGRPLKSFSIRKEPKGHGVGGRLVGPIAEGDRVVVLEDTTTTGGSMLQAVDELERNGVEVIQVLSLVDRSDGVVAARLAERGLPYVALVEPQDLGLSS